MIAYYFSTMLDSTFEDVTFKKYFYFYFYFIFSF